MIAIVSEVRRVKDARLHGSCMARLWVYIGAALFLLALLLSAILVPDLRILHSLQSLIYVAVIVLAHRNSAWGYGAGFSIAILWNAMGIFVTHLIQTGAVAFWLLLRTGHTEQLVPISVALGGIGHFILIFATTVAVFGLREENS